MRRKNGNHCVTMRFGTDGWENDRANRKFTAFDRGVLESADKRQRVDNASFSDMCQQIIVSCGGHCDRGGVEFVKNRCECHVTIKRMRL